MKLSEIISRILVVIFMILLLAGCTSDNFDNPSPAGREPVIDPDYSGVTIPYNKSCYRTEILQVFLQPEIFQGKQGSDFRGD